jgi:hypothetical protein
MIFDRVQIGFDIQIPHSIRFPDYIPRGKEIEEHNSSFKSTRFKVSNSQRIKRKDSTNYMDQTRPEQRSKKKESKNLSTHCQ